MRRYFQRNKVNEVESMEQKKQRMQELVECLNEAGKAYYQGSAEIMSNYEYDKLYDELLALEKELGITLASSPTVNVGYEVLSELPKERHEKPMLSLDKTKEVFPIKRIFGNAKSENIMEAGWAYDCADLSKRYFAKGGYKRKRGSRRGYYEQCESV